MEATRSRSLIMQGICWLRWHTSLYGRMMPSGLWPLPSRNSPVLEAAPDNPLADTSWIATAYWDGAQMASVLEGTALTAAFGAGGQLNGTAGCNTYSASYLVEGRSLAITPPSLSSAICGEPEGVMEQETAFLNTLTSAGGYNLEGGELFILGASGQAVLEFVPATITWTRAVRPLPTLAAKSGPKCRAALTVPLSMSLVI